MPTCSRISVVVGVVLCCQALALADEPKLELGDSPLSNVVFAEWEDAGKRHSVPGIVVRDDAGESHVVALEGKVQPAKEVTLRWNIYNDAKSATVKQFATNQDWKLNIFPAPQEAPKPLPTATPGTLHPGSEVAIWGYKLRQSDDDYKPGRFLGIVTSIGNRLGQPGRLISIHTESSFDLDFGVVVDVTEKPVACLLPTAPYSRRGTEPTLTVTPLEALPGLFELRTAFSAVMPSAIGDEQTEYEFAVQFSDPRNVIKNPQVVIVPAQRGDQQRPKAGETLEGKPLDLTFQDLPANFVNARIVTARDSQKSWMVRFSGPNPGVVQAYGFKFQVRYLDREGKAQLLPVNDARVIAVLPYQRPASPLVEHRAVDLPIPELLADGSYRLTGKQTRGALAASQRTRFPAPVASGRTLAQPARKRVGGTLTLLDVPFEQAPPRYPAKVLPSMYVGNAIYLVSQGKTIHRIHKEQFKEEAKLTCDFPIQSLTESKAGLVVSFAERPEVWVLDEKLAVKRELLFGKVRSMATTRDSDIAFVMDYAQWAPTQYAGHVLWMVNLQSGEVLQALRQYSGNKNSYHKWAITLRGPKPTVAQRRSAQGQSPLPKHIAYSIKMFDFVAHEMRRAIRQYVGEANYQKWEVTIREANVKLNQPAFSLTTFEPIEYGCGAMYLTVDGKQLVLYGERMALFRIEGSEVNYVADVPLPPNRQSTLSFSPDGKQCSLFFAKQERAKLLIYDFPDFSQPIAQLEDSELSNRYALASADRVYLAGKLDQINVLDAKGKSLATVPNVAALEILPIDATRVLVRTAKGYAICSTRR